MGSQYLVVDSTALMCDRGFFRDDPVFRSGSRATDFFQSGRHKGEEHFWRNVNRTTPHRPDDSYTDGYDGYYYRTDRRGNRYLSGASTSTNETNSSEEELSRDLKLTKEKAEKDEEEEEKKKKKVQQENESIYAGSVYDGSMYGGSTYGGSVYGDGVWPRRRKSFFKICNSAPSFYPNLSR